MPRSTFTTDRERWPYGRIWWDERGKPTYHIRVRINGRLYQPTTRRHNLEAALAEYKRFEHDPDGYDPRGDVGPEALHLTPKLIEAFLAWSKNEKGNTPEWVRNQNYALTFWYEKLYGLDLRAGGRRGQVSLKEHVEPALLGVPSRAQRIRVLKAFYSWLRKVKHDITPNEDPTLDTLSAPQSDPALLTGKKRIVADADFFKVLAKLDEHAMKEPNGKRTGPWGDMLLFLGGTGCHVTELLRFMRGDGEVHDTPGVDGSAGVIVVKHKTSKAHAERVTARVLEAAKRLLGRGGASRREFERAVEQACTDANVKKFTPGTLRHKYVTFALQHGATLPEVGGAVGHESIATTGIYKGFAATKKVPSIV